MIVSSTDKLALKCPECENLHTEFHKDPFWDGPYLMCASTIYLASQIIAPWNPTDYCKLYLSFPVKDIDRATPQITKDRKKVALWRCQNGLLINPDKMKLLLIGTCQMLQNVLADLDLHVTLLGKELHPVLAAKDPRVHGCYIKF